MNISAPHPDPHRTAAQQAAARRFGIAIVTTTVGIASFAFVVYMTSPGGTLQPRLLHESSLAGAHATSPTDTQLMAVLNSFVSALERDDDAGMRAAFPALTARESRILHQMRGRLGPAAHLSVVNAHARKLKANEVAEDFVIVASQPGGRELRLPFAAVMHQQNQSWQIVELH